jgi:hypothetical protein
MQDRVLFPLISVLALAMIGLALVWPQGLGARSPWPFGHAPTQQSQETKVARARAAAPQPVLSLAPTPSAEPASAPEKAP